MRAPTLAILTICLVARGVCVPAQSPVAAPARPDFSGSWTLVNKVITPAPGAVPPLAVFAFGQTLSIQQDASSLAVAIWRVRLDGTTTRAEDGSTSRAVWDGDALVLTETEPPASGAAPVEHRCVLKLAADGTLSVDLTSNPVQDAVLIHSVYRRAASTGSPVPAGGVYSPGNGVRNPVVVHEEKPAYTEAAIRAKVQGTIELGITIRPDGSVDPSTITVVKSVDKKYGLDDQAIAAARRWTFRPATLEATGAAVAYRATIEMTFTLGRR